MEKGFGRILIILQKGIIIIINRLDNKVAVSLVFCLVKRLKVPLVPGTKGVQTWVIGIP